MVETKLNSTEKQQAEMMFKLLGENIEKEKIRRSES
jgi:hypothetical protein